MVAQQEGSGFPQQAALDSYAAFPEGIDAWLAGSAGLERRNSVGPV
ncbi:MAG: hypothetical protein ACR2PL_17755 [Dehalococcoidia bacterium]